MNRYHFRIALGIVAFIVGIAALASPALADSITYDISYDPTSGITTLCNLSSSSTALEFWTREGPLEGTPLFLAPGGTVTIGKNGAVTGPFTRTGRQHINKKNKDGTITITINGPATYIDPTTGLRMNVAAGQSVNVTYLPGQQINIDIIDGGSITSPVDIDAQIINISNQFSFILDSPNFPEPGQANLELLSGGLQITDDTLNFTSAFTPDGAVTGCTPEPDTFVLLGSALACLGTLKRRPKGRFQK